MKKKYLIFIYIIICIACSNIENKSSDKWLRNALNTADYQLRNAAAIYRPGLNPRSILSNGSIKYADPKDWTCGFFPGSLWYMYEITGNEYFKNKAISFTEALDSVQYYTHTHDLGFMLYCSYGNAFRLTNQQKFKNVLLQGAQSLASRYNPSVGCIRSWDFDEWKWKYPVIVDNMMNLEYLLWASNVTGDKKYKEISISHAIKTKNSHYRIDNSCYHVISFNPETGDIDKKDTHQGYSVESTWARGQAWGLYGFTKMYYLTGKKEFLDHAGNIARFLIKHPRLPKDMIPYWDFDAPDIPNAPRDASAAAIIASALIELSELDESENEFLLYAEKILKTLSGNEYLALKGENEYFLLKHSVGALPLKSEIDTPINYADYYYLEALIRYCKKKNIDIKDFI